MPVSSASSWSTAAAHAKSLGDIEGGGGAGTAAFSRTCSDQFKSVPVFLRARSSILSVQVPAILVPSHTANEPDCGLKIPLNGAVPAVIDRVASSSKIV